MSSLEHIQYLTETIGPRGSATEEETKAADYVADQLSAHGLSPERERFLGAASSYAPYALCTGLTLVGLILLWQTQPVGALAAFILTGVAFVSLLLELSFQPNLLRWCLPVDDSQNVVANIPCVAGSTPVACAQTLVITAHLDTHRTPLVFSSPTWLKLFQLLLPAGVVSIAVLLVLFAIGVFVPSSVVRLIALAPGLVVLSIFLLMIQADMTPFTRGADDNASGVAISLQLAGRLAQAPLKNTRVIVVFTGCEEVGDYGADAFLHNHRDELANAMHLVIDQVGGKGTQPCVVRGERFLLSAPSDPKLLAIADAVRAQHPELDVSTMNLSIAYGELSIGVKHHLRAIALGSLRKDGTSPHWHQATDVMANVDETVLERSQEYAWLLLQAIDAAAQA